MFHGAGVGGGSLVYANTLLRPPDQVFQDPRRPGDQGWKARLEPHCQVASFMLGVAEAKQTFVADELLRQAVDEETGRGHTFSRHEVGVMQPVSNSMRLRLRRRPWGRRLASETGDGERPPTYLPLGNRLAARMAEKMHGTPGSVLLEVLANTSSTAHILGGATMGRTPGEGVCDERGRVFGYENLWVADGSLVPANLGVNPALTITALCEYVMAQVPQNSRGTPRPAPRPAPRGDALGGSPGRA